MATRWVIGTMTGTSLDALDASLIRIEGEGVAMHATLERHATADLGPLRPRLRAACDGTLMSARDFAALALDFGRLHADTIGRLAGTRRLDLVAVHGQTVTHAPPCSWQLVNPWPIALAARCAVASDLRGADLAAGGEGAPITPLADWILFRDATPTAIVNLGGFCNITWLPSSGADPEGVRGADICPCNHLLDAAAKRHLGMPFDPDGGHACRGRTDGRRAAGLCRALEAAGSDRRSLGSGDEGRDLLQVLEGLAADDAVATLASALGSRIGTAASAVGGIGRVVLAGGGARNRGLGQAIASASPGATVISSAELGMPVEARESMEMAVLGALAWDGVRITLPSVTRRGSATARDGLWCLPPT